MALAAGLAPRQGVCCDTHFCGAFLIYLCDTGRFFIYEADVACPTLFDAGSVPLGAGAV
jgi:hypothetical protein